MRNSMYHHLRHRGRSEIVSLNYVTLEGPFITLCKCETSPSSAYHLIASSNRDFPILASGLWSLTFIRYVYVDNNTNLPPHLLPSVSLYLPADSCFII